MRTGDAITPREIRYRFRLMLEDRSIEVWVYNLETVLAEKLETVITRTVTNTRMRDFYDIHILLELHGERLDGRVRRIDKMALVFVSDFSAAGSAMHGRI